MTTIFEKGKRSIITTMQKFGEMCIATYKDNSHQAKLANHGTPCNQVGYAEGHPTNAYQIFIEKSYGESTKVEKPLIMTTYVMRCQMRRRNAKWFKW